MKPSNLVLILAAAFHVASADAQTPLVTPAAQAAGSLKLPTTRPGSYIAGKRPLVAPPPAGLPSLVLPPAFPVNVPSMALDSNPAPTIRDSAKRAVTQQVTPSTPAEEAKADATPLPVAAPTLAPATSGEVDPKAAAAPKPAAPRKPSNVFLSRDALQKTRDKCHVQLKATDLKFGAAGGEQTVRLQVSGGRACVKAISASHDWLTVSALGPNDEVTVTVAENEESAGREGTVAIANTGSSVHVKVRQDANTSGFRRIEL